MGQSGKRAHRKGERGKRDDGAFSSETTQGVRVQKQQPQRLGVRDRILPEGRFEREFESESECNAEFSSHNEVSIYFLDGWRV